jgi:hypothetical protein
LRWSEDILERLIIADHQVGRSTSVILAPLCRT